MILNVDRKELKQRIYNRVIAMIKDGWIEEVEYLLSKYSIDDYGFKTVGYREIADYINGNLQKDELPEKIYVKTWRYAKRQITWSAKYQHYDKREAEERLLNNYRRN